MAGVILFLTGCASPVDWDKPGASVEARNNDALACQSAAKSTLTVPRRRTDPIGAEPPDAERLFQEGRRYDECMRRNGYALRAK